jgi:uncharacterized membrane protein YedE/YeeE
MSLPLFAAGALSPLANVITAVAIGIAFGFALERAGLGSATKLAGQFYLRDFTVFKVMFTAIVTAMIGVLVLSQTGLLDVSKIAIPGTWLLPQLVGGLLFGVGFVMGGLCPGTSCVAAAAGKLDGVALIVGLLAGTFVFGEVFPLVQGLYEATPRGTFTLPAMLRLPEEIVVAIVCAAAGGGFILAEKLERSTLS